MAGRLKMYLVKTLRDLLQKSPAQLVEERYQKFRRIGPYLESPAGAPVA